MKKGRFRLLTLLDVSHNRLTALDKQGLALLPCLETLDASHNALGAFEPALEELSRCAALRVLNITCVAGRPTTPAEDAAVIHQLRGLRTYNNAPVASQLTPAQWSCVEFLGRVAGVQANRLVAVDLRKRKLGSPHFFWVLAALAELPVETLEMAGNSWDLDADGRGNGYQVRRCCIAFC